MTRILVAEDDEAVRTALRKALLKEGYEVEEASDGATALALHRDRPADLFLIDVYMPEMDGVETMIRLLVEFPGAKVIAISGGGHRNGADVLKMAAGLGAARTLTKPIEITELLTAVREVLGALNPGG